MTDVQEQAGKAPGARHGRPWYRTWHWWGAGVLLLVAASAGIASALAWTSKPAPSGTPGTSTSAQATTDVDTPIAAALTAEQEARATYANVIDRLGDVQPFTAVRSAETRHIATLTGLAHRYSVNLPAGTFSGETSPTTLRAACQLGVSTEQDIVTMYDELLTQVNERDVTQAFEHLQAAARDDHLAAFQRCVRATGVTPGEPTATPTAATTQAPAALSTALITALTTEEKAEATYENMTVRFGDVRPFSAATDAQDEHVDALENLAVRDAVTLPSTSPAGLDAPTTITAACQLGVTTEQQIVTMYDTLLPQVTGDASVTTVFTNLQAAARDNLLPAFERCV